MASQYTISQIIQYAQISLYLSANDTSYQSLARSGSLIGRQPSLLYVENTLLQNAYNLTPSPESNTTIREVAEYVLSLCGKYLIQARNILNSLSAAPPVIAGPSNQSVNVGGTATFTVSVSSTLPYTVQWYDSGGNPIIGATGLSYVVTNAQLTDSGKTFFAKATSMAGTTTSNIASLTVNSTLVANWWYGSTDPYPALSVGTDNLTYQINQNIVHNSPIVITYPTAATNNQYWVLRYPDTENDKTIWNNTSSNFGTIPDSTQRAIFIQNGYKYVVSRTALSLDSTASTLTYS